MDSEAELTAYQVSSAVQNAERLQRRLDRLRVCVECGRSISLVDPPHAARGSRAYCTCEPFGPPMVKPPTDSPFPLTDDEETCVVCGDREGTHTEYEWVDGGPIGGPQPVCEGCRGTVDEGRSEATDGGER